MAVGLTHAEMDLASGQLLSLLPLETVTYRLPPTVDTTLQGHFSEFSKREQALNPALVTMRKLRLRASAIADPKRNATIIRADATRWSVDLVEGGPGRPWWILTVRQS